MMITITFPPEIEQTLIEEASKKGMTPEMYAVDCLRTFFSTSRKGEVDNNNETLFDFLSGYAGTIDGVAENYSEDCGSRFTQHLLDKKQEKHL